MEYHQATAFQFLSEFRLPREQRTAGERISLWINFLHNSVLIELSSPVSLCGEHMLQCHGPTFRKQYRERGWWSDAERERERRYRQKSGWSEWSGGDMTSSSRHKQQKMWKRSWERLSREQSLYNHHNCCVHGRVSEEAQRTSRESEARIVPPQRESLVCLMTADTNKHREEEEVCFKTNTHTISHSEIKVLYNVKLLTMKNTQTIWQLYVFFSLFLLLVLVLGHRYLWRPNLR